MRRAADRNYSCTMAPASMVVEEVMQSRKKCVEQVSYTTSSCLVSYLCLLMYSETLGLHIELHQRCLYNIGI